MADPIEEKYTYTMNAMAGTIARAFPGMGFALFITPFTDQPEKVNYISNANREDMLEMLHETLKRFEFYDEVESISKHKRSSRRSLDELKEKIQSRNLSDKDKKIITEVLTQIYLDEV
ncbi:hypothetical protein BH10BAC5_BH10BAC5_17190 [soil metagenome]